MKIVVFAILFTVRGLNIDDGLTNNESLAITFDSVGVTQLSNINESKISVESDNDTIANGFDIDAVSTPAASQISISSDETSMTRARISTIIHSDSSSSFALATTDFNNVVTEEYEQIIADEQWLNVNQSHGRHSFQSFPLWRRSNDSEWHRVSYVLTSEPQCVSRMCSVRLQYNGTLSNSTSGCLTFTVQTHGIPMGQMWIVDDLEQENSTQKIQMSNRSLHVEHSLRSRLKHLSIETRILFRDPKLDNVVLSNVKINWKGVCPSHRTVATPFPHINQHHLTSEDRLLPSARKESQLISTSANNGYFSVSPRRVIESSTDFTFYDQINETHLFSFFNHRNIWWCLTLVSCLCVLVILGSFGYEFWLTRQQHYFVWNVNRGTRIYFLSRRSIRSSTRSHNKIPTISELTYDALHNESHKEPSDIAKMNSSRSTPISYHTYL